jgi:hypothetical protein
MEHLWNDTDRKMGQMAPDMLMNELPLFSRLKRSERKFHDAAVQHHFQEDRNLLLCSFSVIF